MIFFSLYFCTAQSFDDEIKILLSELGIKHSNIIRSSSHNKDKTLLKELSYLENYSKSLWIKDVDMENKNIVLINSNEIRQQDIQQFLNHNLFHKMLIIDIDGTLSSEELSINIGQEVYFYDKTTAEVLEAYDINGLKIKRVLGYYQDKNKSFTWTSSKNQNIFRRRGNFHGLKLKAMVEHFYPTAIIDKKYIEKARFFKSNQTYLMNGFVKGIYIDILEHLQENLNFTTTLYKRKDVSYGKIIDWKNGTITGEGMISDIFFKRADMIIIGVLIDVERSLYVDYLRAISPFKWGLYISKRAVHDSIEYDNYFKAFHLYSWIIIMFSIIVIGLVKLLIFVCIGEINSSYILIGMKLIWFAMKSIFGGIVSYPNIDYVTSQKVILFIWSLCGNIIWIYYRSQITALLSISNPSKPFYDLESMANTNWR